MTREQLLRSEEYHITHIECDLFSIYQGYKKNINFSQEETDNLTVKKLVQTAMSCGLIPVVRYIKIEDYLEQDKTTTYLRE